MAKEEVMLLDLWASMFGMRVRIALAEKEIPYDYSEQDLWNKSRLLLDMNPVHKKIPVLIHNGKPVCESSIIVQYIDEVWSSSDDKPPLLPSHPYAKAQARFWVDYIDKKVYQNGKNLYTTKGEEHELAKKEFLDCLKVIEKELGKKPYFGGESFGYVDVCLIPFYTWFHTYETFGNFIIEHECPMLIAGVKMCFQNKTSVSQVLPNSLKIYEFVLHIRKKMGLDDEIAIN